MPKGWWISKEAKHKMRIYHPNAREFELRDLDVQRFVADCVVTNAEAIVVSAGGLYAFYPTEVPYHYVSPVMGDRDLLGEIVAEAHARGLRVIARVDFSRAREDVYRAHPEWFQRLQDGNVARAGEYYRTCPVAGYQNAEMAHLVLAEILTRYHVDGFHVNAGGFGGDCHCARCEAAFGRRIPAAGEAEAMVWQQYLAWRTAVVGEQMRGYYDLVRSIDPEVFFMAELAGPEHPAWARSAGHRLLSLSRAFSGLLVTAGGLAHARQSRRWVSIAAELARAARRRRAPIINIKAQMRDMGWPQAILPPAELALYCYQALAHGAGLKVPTFGIPARQADSRVMAVLARVFSFMRQQQEVLDTMDLIAHVALVWPERAIQESLGAMRPTREPAQGPVDGLRGELVGLFELLQAQHALFGILYDAQISLKRLNRYQTVILPTVVGLTDEQIDVVASFVRQGGNLILLDSVEAYGDGSYRPMPSALASLIGGTWTTEKRTAAYAMPVSDRGAWPGRRLGPLAFSLPYRKIIPDPEAHVWLEAAHYDGAAAPEDLGELLPGEDVLGLSVVADMGVVHYVPAGLGRMYLDIGHEDYVAMLHAMLRGGSVGRPYLLASAPSSVEVTMAHWRYGVVVHLANACGPAPLDEPTPVGPIELDLAWDGPAVADLCVPGASPQALQCREEWNRVRIVVPRLDAYAQVVVRSA